MGCVAGVLAAVLVMAGYDWITDRDMRSLRRRRSFLNGLARVVAPGSRRGHGVSDGFPEPR